MQRFSIVAGVPEARHHMGSSSSPSRHPEAAEPHHHMGSWLNPSRHPEVAEPRQDNRFPSPFAGEGRISMRGTSIRNSGEGYINLSKVNSLPSCPPAFRTSGKRAAFTLAEVLITLAIIGVVAAMTIPTLVKNYQSRVLTTQVRTAKYKLTLATDKMKSLGLIEAYPTTADFVNELQKHFRINKVCDNNNLRACWPSDKISVPTTSGTFTEVDVNTLKTGADIKALGIGTSSTATMGIMAADGVSMILTYSPKCIALDPSTSYSWSREDNKPVTNATTNCISAIIDVNGNSGPNRIGKDVRTLNSLFGSVQYSATSVDLEGCKALKSEGLVKDCYYETDYYAGAVKKCNDIGLHLPDPQTLAVIAGAKYGRTDIGTYTLIMSDEYAKTQNCGDKKCTSCTDFYNNYNYSGRATRSDKIICTPSSIPNGVNSSIASLSGLFWSSSEVSKYYSFNRSIGYYDFTSSWNEVNRNNAHVPLCVGD